MKIINLKTIVVLVYFKKNKKIIFKKYLGKYINY